MTPSVFCFNENGYYYIVSSGNDSSVAGVPHGAGVSGVFVIGQGVQL